MTRKIQRLCINRIEKMERDLAIQNLYAVLVIQNEKTIPDVYQEKIDTFHKQLRKSITSKLTNVNTNDYTITNIENACKYLPPSIFDHILTIPDNFPDFRYVSVRNSNKPIPGLKVARIMNVAGTVKPVEVRLPYTISSSSILMDVENTDLGDTTDLDKYKKFQTSGPLSLELTKFGNLYSDFKVLIRSSSGNDVGGITQMQILNKVLRMMNVDDATKTATLDGKNKHLNDKTVKTGLVSLLLSQASNQELELLSRKLEDFKNIIENNVALV